MQIEELNLSNETLMATIWQGAQEGDVAQAALVVRTYLDETLSVRQDGQEILLNAASVKEITKLLNRFAKHTMRANTPQ